MRPEGSLPWRPARTVVTGGAGFVGSFLCERLLDEGVQVLCVDNFLTGDRQNVHGLAGRHGFTLLHHDVTEPFEVNAPVDAVLHLACPASPRDYTRLPIETLRAGSMGTLHALELARRTGARFLLASSSEVYGNPRVHPQPESYAGNVNPVGPRSQYDEGKRFSEAAAAAYARQHGMEVRIARIFNTYGPRMRRGDGRVVPAFVTRALRSRPLTIHGDGSQTRSLCYVTDLVDGLWRLLSSDHRGPVNLGNPEERSVLEIAAMVSEVAGTAPRFEFSDPMPDDPLVRCPDISTARAVLGWAPSVGLREGLERTVAWFRDRLVAAEPA